jgi:hypothetical protein
MDRVIRHGSSRWMSREVGLSVFRFRVFVSEEIIRGPRKELCGYRENESSPHVSILKLEDVGIFPPAASILESVPCNIAFIISLHSKLLDMQMYF